MVAMLPADQVYLAWGGISSKLKCFEINCNCDEKLQISCMSIANILLVFPDTCDNVRSQGYFSQVVLRNLLINKNKAYFCLLIM